MSQLEAALRRLGADLQALGSRWALIGGVAVSARAEPRTTRDVELAAASDREAESIEEEIVEAAELLEVFPGLTVPVATRAHLLATKVLAGRAQDIADAKALVSAAVGGEMAEARAAVAIIAARGCSRGRDLQEVLRRLESGEPIEVV